MSDAQTQSNGSPLRRVPWRPVALLAAVTGLWLAGAYWDLGAELRRLDDWIAGLGPAAPAAFIAVRAGAAVLVIPGSAVSALGGVLFPPVLGVVCVSTGKTIGAAAAFLIGRHFARDSVESRLADSGAYRRLDRMVREHGALVVALNRFFPVIPFNLQNYGFGLTAVPFATYLLWTWLGMLPGAVLVVTGMGVIRQTLRTGRVPWGLVGAVGASAVAMLGLAAYTAVRLFRGGQGEPSDPAAEHPA